MNSPRFSMEYLVKPWQHQQIGIERASKTPYFAFLYDVGTGKTMTAINTLRHKMNQERRIFKTLIFCPPNVIPAWQKQFSLHSNIAPSAVVPLIGSATRRLKTFLEYAYNEGAKRPCFFIANYESLLMDDLFLAFQKWAPDAVIFDESHRVKNYKAQRSKRADRLANPKTGRKPYTYILTGTPILNSPMDLFFQYKIMDGGATFGNNFFIFRARYFEDKNAGMLLRKDTAGRYFPDWRVKPGAMEEMNRLIYKFGMRAKKEECLDLPEEITIKMPCGMTPEQAKNYKEMKQDFITYMGGEACTASLAIVKALRLMQITSGFLPLNPTGGEDDGAKIIYDKAPKRECLKQLLEDIAPSAKVIVWAVWKENYAIIRKVCEELDLKYVEVHGQVSSAKQKENIASFQNDPDIRVFISHPGSGGIGIDLTCAYNSIFYSRTFSLEHYLQARARDHRGGQKNKVTHWELVVENTIDEAVQERLSDKFDMSEKLLQNIVDVLALDT